MTYIKAIDYITSIYHLGSKLGLERIKLLTERLGSPQNKLKIIHVAGTNGKGSTCAMLSSILSQTGLKVGMYTSPHLERYNERFIINGIPISDCDFAKQMKIIKKHCDDMIADGYGCPTVFECLTALAFNYFYESQVDVVILEVGLGGSLDATNIINNTLLSIITSISLDHTEYLGSCVADIAKEKGGIVKENSNVVLQTQSKEVYNIISDICKNKNSNLFYNNNLAVDIIEYNLSQTVFNIFSDYFTYNSIAIKLLGKYQIYNACTVLLAVAVLRRLSFNITDSHVYSGLLNATWSGRMEIVKYNPYVVLDGAHNIEGVKVLCESINRYFKNMHVTLLIAFLADKEYTSMLHELMSFASCVVVTEVPKLRALDADLLFSLVNKYNKTAYIEKNIKISLSKALNITPDNGVVCCCGSLYLVGELRRFL